MLIYLYIRWDEETNKQLSLTILEWYYFFTFDGMDLWGRRAVCISLWFQKQSFGKRYKKYTILTLGVPNSWQRVEVKSREKCFCKFICVCIYVWSEWLVIGAWCAYAPHKKSKRTLECVLLVQTDVAISHLFAIAIVLERKVSF